MVSVSSSIQRFRGKPNLERKGNAKSIRIDMSWVERWLVRWCSLAKERGIFHEVKSSKQKADCAKLCSYNKKSGFNLEYDDIHRHVLFKNHSHYGVRMEFYGFGSRCKRTKEKYCFIAHKILLWIGQKEKSLMEKAGGLVGCMF